jgi:hypothetical protein
MNFNQLDIGDTFDFISPKIGANSFFSRCTKISARKYSVMVDVKISRKVLTTESHEYKIGSVFCPVYNVIREASK